MSANCPELAAEVEELRELQDRLRVILNNVAIAVNGPEPPLTKWSWHDLAEKVEALKTGSCNRCHITRQETNALAEKLRKAKAELFWERVTTPKERGTHVLCEDDEHRGYGHQCFVDLRTGEHSEFP